MEKRNSFLRKDKFKHKGSYRIEDHIHDGCTLSSNSRNYKTILYNSQQQIKYFEAKVVKTRGSCRIGWSTTTVEQYGPLGYDEKSYCYQTNNGYSIINKVRRACGERLDENDILSTAIYTLRKKTYIEFFINGRNVGEPIPVNHAIFKKGLVPSFSLFNSAEVSVFLGPYFIFREKVMSHIEAKFEEKPKNSTKSKQVKK